MGEARWQSAHVYYFDENKNDLILDGIRPLFQKTRAVSERHFFVRHWLRGPHLRLRFFCTDEQFAQQIRPLLESEIGAYLRHRPSRTLLEEEKLRPVYERLAAQEQEEGPVWPLYPDNSLQYIPYDNRLQVLDSPALVSLLEDFYVDTNELAFAMLDYLRQGHTLFSLSFDLMVTVAHTLGMHLTRGFISYRSHAEGFLLSCAQPGSMRAVFERKYSEQSAILTRRLRRLLEALDLDEDTFPFTLSWSKLMATYWARAEALERNKQLGKRLDVTDLPEPNEQLRARLVHSDFHSALESDQERKRALYNDSWFQCYRLVLNLLYLHLNRLGLRPLDRFLLCHLVANATEQVFDINVVELMLQGAGIDWRPW